jgi:hypothetical protein
MNLRSVALTGLVLLGLACKKDPNDPDYLSSNRTTLEETVMMQQRAPGSGLTLNSITGVTLPLIGRLGDVVIDQAVLTNFALVENAVGAIVGLEVEGVLQLTGGVLGTDVITEDFNTIVSVTSSGPGQCDLITIDLGPIGIDALIASVDVPAATLTGRGSGAVGSLLCALGSLLGGLTGGGIIPGASGIVNALNNQI